MSSVLFNINGASNGTPGPQPVVTVTVVENEETMTFVISPCAASTVGDISGHWFDLADDSRIDNEALVFEYRKESEPSQRLSYTGISGHADRQQMEFCMAAAIQMYCHLNGRQLSPPRGSMVPFREEGAAAFARIPGTEVALGSEVDQIVFPSGAAEFPLVDADRRLNQITIEVGEDALNSGTRAAGTSVGPVRMLVENAVTPLLPHGTARADIVAKKLAMSERTLARRLAQEGVTFMEVVQQLKATLARHYLAQKTMPISKIAWLLGFEEQSSFSHACKRWTGKTPRELRSAAQCVFA